MEKNATRKTVKGLQFVLVLATIVPFTMAYLIAHTLKVSDREDMPTPKEWFEMAFENEVE